MILFFQVILPLLKSDLYEVIQSTLDGLLNTSLPVWLENHTAITVVMASKGYPGAYTKGVEITGEWIVAKRLGYSGTVTGGTAGSFRVNEQRAPFPPTGLKPSDPGEILDPKA